LELEELMKGREHFENERASLEREIKDRDNMIKNLKERLDIS
jgi:hypothetical protein